MVNIIGAGLAGCEAALYLAKRKINVRLYEQKPIKMSPAHKSENFAELVCSNSLKSFELTNACGLLKEEITLLGSSLMPIAKATRVEAGSALAVDRDLFSEAVTNAVKNSEFIEIIYKEVSTIPKGVTIITSGPLTDGQLYDEIKQKCGVLHFYDCSSPIVTSESIDYDNSFFMSRYGKGEDYLNCPLSKEEYLNFVNELVNGKCVILKDFEKREIFEGCMPIEIMAKKGIDTLRFGMLKPVGLYDKQGKRPYAVVQLRKENQSGTLYNLVGFQTNLTFGEQKRVFSLIPALKNAEFVRLGVMHRNSFINSRVLNKHLQLKTDKDIYIGGQLCGVEGYVESIASGLLCAINIAREIEGKEKIIMPPETVLGSLVDYITNEEAVDLQPMNSNFGIIAPVDMRDKKAKKEFYASRSQEIIKKIASELLA